MQHELRRNQSTTLCVFWRNCLGFDRKMNFQHFLVLFLSTNYRIVQPRQYLTPAYTGLIFVTCQLFEGFTDLYFKQYVSYEQCIYSNAMISNIADWAGQSHILSKMLSDLLLLFEDYIYQPDCVSRAANKPMCLLFDSLR